MFMAHLAEAMQRIGPGFGQFRIYLGDGASERSINLLKRLQGCVVEPFGSSYAHSLSNSKSAMLFGGSNSLVDVLAVGIPALVVLRSMRDKEQQEHLASLTKAEGVRLLLLDEKDCSPDTIHQNLLNLMSSGLPEGLSGRLNLDGAANAARALVSLL